MKRESLGGNVDGVLRQYIALPAQVLTKVPEESDVSFVQMASLVASGVTAWNALFGVQPLKAGQTVLFQGTGGVSIIGLQLAKAAGATTIITSSSDEKLKFVQENRNEVLEAFDYLQAGCHIGKVGIEIKHEA
ncbi:hypothetical protein AM588_10009661 [Phytophthora nicotianae]|uniref:Enoyl reductase (ER) domain-containing protein n=1 Tax=Phytophthora nicotianae TaxID=4792 RepID=A0A0W8D430_PHYNI|nr:hypothetical protein AM588_10009661 [Phytophthora nicotianae]